MHNTVAIPYHLIDMVGLYLDHRHFLNLYTEITVRTGWIGTWRCIRLEVYCGVENRNAAQ
jgi:hypothetical protein